MMSFGDDTLGPNNMATASPWHPIVSAPKSNNRSYNPNGESTTIDILAKRWFIENDAFKFMRFTDCEWDWNDKRWTGVPPDWLAVAWMPIPAMPEKWP